MMINDSRPDATPIVVGVDGTAGSKAALAWAGRQARLEGKPLLTIKCWEPVTIGWAPYPSDILDSMRIEAEKELHAAIDDVFGTDRPVGIETRVIQGPAGHVLVASAANSALLVVGRRAHHEWGGHLGSTSAYCARHAQCPVVVVHH